VHQGASWPGQGLVLVMQSPALSTPVAP
jgi:hypothetical protein